MKVFLGFQFLYAGLSYCTNSTLCSGHDENVYSDDDENVYSDGDENVYSDDDENVFGGFQLKCSAEL